MIIIFMKTIVIATQSFSPFQDQADQSKQVTYSVSGGSGFKVKLVYNILGVLDLILGGSGFKVN